MACVENLYILHIKLFFCQKVNKDVHNADYIPPAKFQSTQILGHDPCMHVPSLFKKIKQCGTLHHQSSTTF